MEKHLADESDNEGEHAGEKKQPRERDQEERFDEKAVFIDMRSNDIIANTAEQTCYQK